MSVKLGMFTMPFHHPDRDYASILAEDQEAVILADQLGFSEAYVGEHFSSWSERITSPLIFLATVISRTRQIRLGTGVLHLPQTHPAPVAPPAGPVGPPPAPPAAPPPPRRSHPAPAPARHGGRARGHVRPALGRALHHGHRAGRAG